MRSSTPNPSSIHALKTDKRFDALLKQEMMEHQHIISCHNKEMQALRDFINISIEKFYSFFSQLKTEVKDISLFFNEQINLFKEKIFNSELILSDQKKAIESLHSQINDFHEIYVSKDYMNNFKKEILSQLNDSTKNHLSAFQDLQRGLKILVNDVENDLVKLRHEMDQRLVQLTDKVDKNFSLFSIDKEGVLNEVRIYEKTVFIIEKKIENIYTLIERINKKIGEICHKPE